MKKLSKYNTEWEIEDGGEVKIEMAAIRKGGRWKGKDGQDCGEGLLHHYEAYWKLLWGREIVFHRWNRLLIQQYIANKIIMVFGPQDSSKTNTSALWGLSNYYLSPHNTAVLISSIDIKGLRLRVWAEIVKFHTIAQKRHPWLPGHFIESETMLTTDARGQARDFRKGVVGIPCFVNGKFVGTQKYAGIKQENIIQIGDEMQAMGVAIVNGISGFMNRPGYKFIGNANPDEPLGPEGKLGEPADVDGGWAGQPEPEKTIFWRTRFPNGVLVNLVGTDSPNFDPETPNLYPFLINQNTLNEVAAFWGKDSKEWYQKCKGVMKAGLEGRRVITRAMCVKFGALEEPVWGAGKIIKLFSLDAAYGSVGGDRCIGNELCFGENVQGRSILAYVNGPLLIPVSVANKKLLPEEQIATWVMEYCIPRDIPPGQVAFDSTGRGTLMAAFARLWSPAVQGIEFGGKATDRPVMEDLFITEHGNKRKKRCDEHYSKFVTELWYFIRYAIENGQFRGLPEEVMMEGCLREWRHGNGGRIEVEPKEDTKERMGRSPDMFDALCFSAGTMILTALGELPIEKIKPGMLVVTPLGFSEVVLCHASESDDLITAEFSNSKHLTATSGHKIFNWKEGWVKLDAIVLGSEVESVDNLPLWNILNSLFTKAGNTGFKAMVDTIRTEGTMRRRDFYTESSGLKIAGLFQAACASIIKTATGLITESKIWNFSIRQAIANFICEIECLMPISSAGWLRKSPQREGCLQRYGTGQKKEQNGIRSTPCSNGRKRKSIQINAATAGVHSRHFSLVEEISAPLDAGGSRLGKGLRILQEFAKCAARNLLLTVTNRQRTVLRTARRLPQQEKRVVYNLTLLDHNAYYANGILVQNCAGGELSRRLGFTLQRFGNKASMKADLKWLDALIAKQRAEKERGRLVYG